MSLEAGDTYRRKGGGEEVEVGRIEGGQVLFYEDDQEDSYEYTIMAVEDFLEVFEKVLDT